jgi:hypothetical protein
MLEILIPVRHTPKDRLKQLIFNFGATTVGDYRLWFLVGLLDTATTANLCALLIEYEGTLDPKEGPFAAARIFHVDEDTYGSGPSAAGNAWWAGRHSRGSGTGESLFTGADDITPMPNWNHAIDSGSIPDHIGVVGTNDLREPDVIRGEFSTHSFIRTRYASLGFCTIDNDPNKLFGPYRHNHADRELVELAKARGMFLPQLDCIVKHEPPGGKSREAKNGSTRDARNADDRLLAQRRVGWANDKAVPGSQSSACDPA